MPRDKSTQFAHFSSLLYFVWSSVAANLSFPSTFCPPSEPFAVHNDTLDYLRGTLGYSYMCREEQTLDVAPDLAINTFQVQVQPFGLSGDQFAAGKLMTFDSVKLNLSLHSLVFRPSAEECQLDEDDMLIPIIVGAALAALVLIVLLAYFIGRKRSHAGYQSI